MKAPILAFVGTTLLVCQPLQAAVIDLSGVSMSGSYPNFSFVDPEFGTVNIDYTAPNHPDTSLPLVGYYGGVTSLMLGGRVDISWEYAVKSLEFRIYDLDLGEYADFILPSGASLSVTESLNGNTLDANGTRVNGVAGDVSNNATTNYIALQASGTALTSIGIFEFRPPSLYGAAGMSFGDPVLVPEPSSWMFGFISVGLWLIRRRR